MKKRKLSSNKVLMILLCLMAAVFMTACSDSAPKELEQNQPDTWVNTAEIQEKESETSESKQTEETQNMEETQETEKIMETEEVTETEGKNGVFYVGDTITDAMYGPTPEERRKTEYTLKKVDIVENINDVGIAWADLMPGSEQNKILESGELDTAEPSKFVVVTVNLKNINIDPNSDSAMVCQMISSTSGCESGILNESGAEFLEACYFSAHPQENMQQDYYRYSLDIGEEMEVRVGWIVPDAQLEEPFYYVLGSWGMPEDYQYFRLNAEE